jgi:hypothetical protein
MTLTEQINNDIKAAMKERNQVKLAALRAIKSALLLAATEKGGGKDAEAEELRMLQKQVKQRREAAEIYTTQGREDLAKDEIDQAIIIEQYLPKQMSEEELVKEIAAIITETGASSPADMGKVMGAATKKLAGKADGKDISRLVKGMLS